MKARQPSQKRLSIEDIQKMTYLSQVKIVGYTISSIYFVYYYISLLLRGVVRDNLRSLTLLEGVSKKVGDGHSNSLWKYVWLGPLPPRDNNIFYCTRGCFIHSPSQIISMC